MLSTTHNLFGNLYFSEPTNGISWYGIHFLFDMCSFNFKLDWNINNNNNNNKTSPMRIQWDYHKKRELFDLMITMTQNYFIGNPCFSKLTNGISWYDIHFLFDVCSLNFKLDWDVNNSNNKTSLMRIQQNYHKKCERFNLMLSKIHNYLFNNLNHFKPAISAIYTTIYIIFHLFITSNIFFSLFSFAFSFHGTICCMSYFNYNISLLLTLSSDLLMFKKILFFIHKYKNYFEFVFYFNIYTEKWKKIIWMS